MTLRDAMQAVGLQPHNLMAGMFGAFGYIIALGPRDFTLLQAFGVLISGMALANYATDDFVRLVPISPGLAGLLLGLTVMILFAAIIKAARNIKIQLPPGWTKPKDFKDGN